MRVHRTSPGTCRSRLAPLASRVVRAAEPKRLIGVIEEDPPFFNPAVSSGISSFVASAPCYSALTRMAVGGEISGDLAESYEISPDGMTYTFKLHRNVEWHDGHPFSSEDVKFSLEQVNSKLHPYHGAMNAIDRFEAPDPDTFALRLKHPQVSLITSLGNFAGAILPRHIWEGKDAARDPHNRQPIGTGPYKLVEYVAGDHILYRRNEKYFLPGQARVRRADVPHHARSLLAHRRPAEGRGRHDLCERDSGDRSGAHPQVPEHRAAVRQDPDLGLPGLHQHAQRPVQRPPRAPGDRPHDRPRVHPQQCLSRAVGEHGRSGTADLAAHNKKLVDYALDPAKANPLLDEAGFPQKADGTRFELRFVFGAQDLPAVKISDIITRNLAGVGIKVIARPLDRGAWIQVAFTNNEFDMTTASFSLGPDPDIGIERFYNSNNIFNIVGVNNSKYVNPEVDKLFDEQRVQTDFAKRKAIYDRISEIVWNDVPGPSVQHLQPAGRVQRCSRQPASTTASRPRGKISSSPGPARLISLTRNACAPYHAASDRAATSPRASDDLRVEQGARGSFDHPAGTKSHGLTLRSGRASPQRLRLIRRSGRRPDGRSPCLPAPAPGPQAGNCALGQRAANGQPPSVASALTTSAPAALRRRSASAFGSGTGTERSRSCV